MGQLDPMADLSLRMGARPNTNHVIHVIGSDIVFPVMAPGLWELIEQQASQEFLCKLPLLHDRDARTARSTWRDAFGPDNLGVRSGARFTSADLVLRAAECGRGVALTRGWLARDAMTEGLLIRPIAEHQLPLKDEWWLAEHRDSGPRKSVQRVRDWLVEEGRLQTMQTVPQVLR